MNKPFQLSLPIDEALPRLTTALSGHSTAVLVAPPGAGKTTRVPLVLMDEPWARAGKSPGKILVLEPRRLAARTAAERMASTLGEKVGGMVGYRVRFGSKVSRSTRVEVVTEGIFTRMIVDDPSLEGVAAVLFDEFHERSLDADLGLALAREAQQGLREDLKLLVMSATIDGARIAALLGDAAVIESEGRAFPVETRHVGRDQTPIEAQVTDTVLKALRADPGSVLVFLPGAAEIRRTETRLKERVTDPSVDIVALYGALDATVQDRAIAPASAGRRKVVLATSIAETSLTIEGVRVVVDSGLARVPRYEPDVGLTRLETVRVSRASADQRRGRAGRTEPGVCYRLWDEGQTASLEPYAKPEILAADLSSFVLDLAQWGVTDPATLAFIDPPPAPALAEARSLLAELGALDAAGRITAEGRRLRALPLPPRLARMIVDAAAMEAAAMAAQVAAILTERGLGGDDIDLAHRLDNFRRDRSRRGEEARRMAARWAEMAVSSDTERVGQSLSPSFPPPSRGREQGDASPGLLLALAYPDRIARNRGNGSFVLANGRGAMVDSVSPLARAPYIAVAELIGSAAQARIVLAAAIGLADIEARFAERIEAREEITVDAATLSLRARRQRRLGAVALADAPMAVTTDEAAARLLAAAIAKAGFDRLPWTKAQQQWRERVLFLRTAEGDEWPDVSEAGLGASIDDWLVPALFGKTSLSQLGADDLGNGLAGLLPHGLRRRLDAEAPTHFAAPSGSQVPIDYGGEDGPKLSIRVQELFGLSVHPTTARGRVPLLIELLSPAHRPVQLTRDLPGFWRGSYAAVRTEMRGRYPRHPWPDDPMSAPATRRAKPRGT
ncbi:ATP-dependent helicase HrpB [Astrobacterium formosum]|uniref:ATP-dependent helicase HrpB n=1 Tax=Astrobacterium formosum TaxID=3069710 RepID=UPI003F4FBFD3